MELFRLIVSPRVLYTGFFIIAMMLIYGKIMDISFKQRFKKTGKNLMIKRLTKDEELYRQNMQLDRIGNGTTGSRKRYRDLIQNVIISMKLDGVTVENFTTLFAIMGLISWVGFSTFFDSILMGALVAVPSIFAVVALVLSLTKASVRANDNRVMDSLDLICPTIEHSVVAAIRNSMGAFDSKIRPHYRNFLQGIDVRDMSLREAITELNAKLGPRFDEFARKALLFDAAGDEGMEEIFMDIVEINAFTRSINTKADVVFSETNFNMLASAGITIGFLWYTYNNPMTSDIMRNTWPGKFASAVSIAVMIMMYAIGQITQMSIDYSQIQSDK